MDKKRKLKLYVWDGVLTDYTSGMIVAMAYDIDHARRLVCKAAKIPCSRKGVPNKGQYGSLALDVMTEPAEFSVPACAWVSGGG
jgi:hypothetical protein